MGYYGTVNMELSDGTVLKFAAPLFTMLLAKFYLKEDISTFKKVGMLFGFVGVVLTARPQFLFSPAQSVGHRYEKRNEAIIAVLGASLCLALSTIITKEIAHSVHYFSLMFFLSVWFVGLAIPLKLIVEGTNIELDGLPTVAILTFGFFLGQVLGFLGISSVPAGVVTLIKNMDTFFGVVFGIIIFNEQLEWNTIVGCVLVFIVTLLLVAESYYLTQKESKMEVEQSDMTLQVVEQ